MAEYQARFLLVLDEEISEINKLTGKPAAYKNIVSSKQNMDGSMGRMV